jgi:acetolactate synthase-1/2/3 large subunit
MTSSSPPASSKSRAKYPVTTNPARAADLLARRLYDAGCRLAFGMPGGEVLTLLDALERAGIRFVLVKHENAAGFMAEAVWSLTGAPGVLVATLGPGAMNGVNVVANAHQDRVPLIVLTGCVDPDETARYTHQVMDHAAVFRTITKDTLTLTPAAAGVIADRAVSTALAPRPGPVHLDVPIAVAAAPAGSVGPRRTPPAASVPAPGPALDAARGALAASDRPVLLAGLDAVCENAGAALTAFAETHGVPVITTYRGKGLLPETHPLSLGAAGLSPLADDILLPLVARADLVIAAGYDPIEMRPGWRDAWDPARQTVIEIAAEDMPHYMHASTVFLRTDIAPTLAALSEGIPPRPTWPEGDLVHARTALGAAFPAGDDWGPAAVIAAARAALPDTAIATVDSGAHRILLSQMWTCTQPRTLLQSTGLCTMGCAIPLAAGAKLVAPDRPVVAFTGDAGFLMIAGELATLAELALPVIIVVFVDASLALIEKKQRERQLPNAGVDFAVHDYAAIGRAFGGRGVTVTDRAALTAALAEAQAADRFTVIAAMIDRGAYDGRI